VSQIVKKIEDTLYQKKEDSEIVDMGGLVYVFPSVKILIQALNNNSLTCQQSTIIKTKIYLFP